MAVEIDTYRAEALDSGHVIVVAGGYATPDLHGNQLGTTAAIGQ